MNIKQRDEWERDPANKCYTEERIDIYNRFIEHYKKSERVFEGRTYSHSQLRERLRY